jgi:hypothetical protein
MREIHDEYCKDCGYTASRIYPSELRKPTRQVVILKLTWKALGPGQLAKSEYGYYLTYRNIDPESRVVRWYAKFEPRSSHFLKQEKWSQSQFFMSLEDAQLFCEEHAQGFEP